MPSRILALGMLLAVFFLAPAQAAETGTVKGYVRSTDGSPISGAAISLSSRPENYAAASDSAGAFNVATVVPGSYILTIVARDYQPVDRFIAVSARTTENVDVSLTPRSTGTMASLGTVRINGSLALSRASAPSVELDAQALAAEGFEQLSGVLSQQIALTMTRPAGGAPGLPQSAALRGPDPSETVIDIDGHQVNNSNTGDFDLELLDPSEFQNAQIVYGIGPSSLVGANTQGGAINFHTIDPTLQPQGLIRLSAASFGTFGDALQATGTSDRIGYALSYHRYTTQGEVNNYAVVDAQSGANVVIGSSILATSTLAKLRYSLGLGNGFVQLTYRSTSAFRDLSAPLATPTDNARTAPGSAFTVMPDANSQTIAPAFGLDLQLPVGRHDQSGITPAILIARHQDSISSQSVPADVEALANPYLFNARDRVLDDSLEFDRSLNEGSLTLAYDVRHETLTAAAALAPGPPQQSQSGRSLVARYEWRPSNQLSLTAGAYASSSDTFGKSFDPRLAAVWSPTAAQVYRASVGTAFRAPLLAERVFNPHLTAERTTEYELGYERCLGEGPRATHAILNVYRTNLRDPIFFSVDASGALTFLRNLGDVVYQGVELRVDKPLSQQLTLHAAYGVSIAYPINNPFAFDPAAPNVVAGQQFQGIPPQKAQLGLQGQAGPGFGYFISAAYESDNNELNRPKYATLAAGVTRTVRHTQISVMGQNLTNQYADKFTLPNAGVPYPTPLGLAPTNAFSLQGASLTLTITQRY